MSELHPRCDFQILEQHSNHNLNDISKLQCKAIQTIKYPPVEPHFKETKSMTLNEKIKLENCLFALYQ